MTAAGWAFMIVSVGVVTAFSAFCVARVLSVADDD